MTAWFPALVLLAIILAGGAIVVLRRTQTRVPDAPIVELATVPSDRGFWLRSRLNETIGGGRPPAPTLDSLTLDTDAVVSPLPQAILSPAPLAAPAAAAPVPVSTPLAMPLAATVPAAPPAPALPHSPFANQAVRDGRIGLMDVAADNPAIAWHTSTAAPTTFSDPTLASSPAEPDADGAISLNRPTPSTIAWSGPSD